MNEAVANVYLAWLQGDYDELRWEYVSSNCRHSFLHGSYFCNKCGCDKVEIDARGILV